MGFRNQYLSVSRLKKFEACPLSFKFAYVDGIKGESGIPATFGNLLHDVLEAIYGWVIAEEFSGRIDEDMVSRLYREMWPASGLVGAELFREGLDILLGYLRTDPMVDHRTILACEMEFKLQIEDYTVKGFIDRVDIIDSETIEVVDYKSNRLIFTQDEVANDIQASVYSMVARQLWPWAKNHRFTFHMLRHGIRLRTERTASQLSTDQDYIVALAKSSERGEYPPKLTPNCPYCDHRLSCEVYQKAVAGDVDMVKTEPADMEALAKERERVANLAKLLYARKSELDDIIKARLEYTDKLEAGGVVYRMSRSAQTRYPVDATLKTLKEMAGLEEAEARAKLTVIEKSKVDDLIDELKGKLERPKHQMLRAHLDAVAEKTFIPKLQASKVRG